MAGIVRYAPGALDRQLLRELQAHVPPEADVLLRILERRADELHRLLLKEAGDVEPVRTVAMVAEERGLRWMVDEMKELEHTET